MDFQATRRAPNALLCSVGVDIPAAEATGASGGTIFLLIGGLNPMRCFRLLTEKEPTEVLLFTVNWLMHDYTSPQAFADSR
jgi:hypothetical protein